MALFGKIKLINLYLGLIYYSNLIILTSFSLSIFMNFIEIKFDENIYFSIVVKIIIID